jgi:hypothetical protein
MVDPMSSWNFFYQMVGVVRLGSGRNNCFSIKQSVNV